MARLMVLAVLSVVLTSCTSVGAFLGTGQSKGFVPRRVFVLINTHDEPASNYVRLNRLASAAAATQCGFDTTVDFVTPGESFDDHAGKLRDFSSDSVLVIDVVGRTVHGDHQGYAVPIAKYDIQLLRELSGSPLWHIFREVHYEDVQGLVNLTTGKLRDSGFLPGCPAGNVLSMIPSRP